MLTIPGMRFATLSGMKSPSHPQHQPSRGFALIEMAATLIVISLLMVGQMKGSQMLDIAREKKLEADFRNLTTAIYVYQDIYGAVPGDDIQADQHLASNSGISGNGNGQIDGYWNDTAQASEASRVWLHLKLAGLLNRTDGNAASDNPFNIFGRPMGIQGGNADPARSPIVNAAGKGMGGIYALCSRGVPGRLVLSLDTKIDDGNPASGAMLATPDHGPNYTPGAGAATNIDPNGEYIVCMGA